jgi:hypothetical protein
MSVQQKSLNPLVFKQHSKLSVFLTDAERQDDLFGIGL